MEPEPQPVAKPAQAKKRKIQQAAPAAKRGRPAKPKAVEVLKLWEVSVTISAGSCDIDTAVMPKLEQFLKDKCEAGMFSFERGGTVGHLHVQGVIRVKCKQAASMTAALKTLFGWNKSKHSVGARIMCRSLIQTGVHTWLGMIGYCIKDFGQERFKYVMQNISDEDISVGQDEVLEHGAAPLKHRIALGPNNVFDRAVLFYNFHERKNPRISLPGVLTHMIKTGKYYPSAQWVVPHQGQGWDRDRANTCWRMLIRPEETGIDDVNFVFGKRGDCYYEDTYDLGQMREGQSERLPALTMPPSVDNRANLMSPAVDIEFVEEPTGLRPIQVDSAPEERVLVQSFKTRS